MEMWITPTLRVTDEGDAVSPDEALTAINADPFLARPGVATLDDARTVMRSLGMSDEWIEGRIHFALTGEVLNV